MTARDVALADLETLKLYEHGYTGRTPCYGNVARHIHHLTEQVKSLEAAQKWQPIETAPKDGTRVLLALRDGMVVTGRWSFVGAEATHWMPLPAAPKGTL